MPPHDATALTSSPTPVDAIVARFAAAIADPALPPPADTIVARGDLASRFAVYRNNAWVARLGVLDDLFPVSRRLVGDEAFRALGRRFFLSDPPIGPVAQDWAEPFADWIAAGDVAEVWPWLVDMARLEAAWMRAHHAAEAVPIALADCAAIAPEALMRHGLRLHPSLALVASPFPIGSIWAAHQGEGEPAPLATEEPETVLVARPDAEVIVVVIAPADAAFAAALMLGESLGAAADAALDVAADFDLGDRLAALFRLGVVIGIA